MAFTKQTRHPGFASLTPSFVRFGADNACATILAGLYEEIAKCGVANVKRIYGDSKAHSPDEYCAKWWIKKASSTLRATQSRGFRKVDNAKLVHLDGQNHQQQTTRNTILLFNPRSNKQRQTPHHEAEAE